MPSSALHHQRYRGIAYRGIAFTDTTNKSNNVPYTCYSMTRTFCLFKICHPTDNTLVASVSVSYYTSVSQEIIGASNAMLCVLTLIRPVAD